MENKHLKLKHNKSGRDFVIGDLHGCLYLLHELMDEVAFDKTQDRMFSVGDLIDRGPDSFKCLKLIDEDWFYTVMGNHEELLRDSILSSDKATKESNLECWEGNGGLWHKDINPDVLKNYAVKIRDEIPYAITIGHEQENSVGLVHAQPPTKLWRNVELERSRPVMTWARTKIQKMDAWSVEGVDRTYHGHTPKKEIVRLGNTTFIDTGAYQTLGKLTMIEITGGLERGIYSA